jgi:hypothetical protein
VVQVRVLENTVFNGPTLVDRNLAGFCLFLLLARARFTDAMLSNKMVWDIPEDEPLQGYVEIQGSNIKTGTSANKKAMLLPMVAPSQGLGSGCWALAWKKARESAGLNCSEFEFVQPCPDLDGGWSSRPWTTSEASRWLRDLFTMYGRGVNPGAFFGAHSLKMSELQW